VGEELGRYGARGCWDGTCGLTARVRDYVWDWRGAILAEFLLFLKIMDGQRRLL